MLEIIVEVLGKPATSEEVADIIERCVVFDEIVVGYVPPAVW